jgi:hypothetical protein
MDVAELEAATAKGMPEIGKLAAIAARSTAVLPSLRLGTHVAHTQSRSRTGCTRMYSV